MQPLIFSPDYGPIELVEGMPASLLQHVLPEARTYYAAGRYGTICLQALQTEKQLLYYFLFHLTQRFRYSFLSPKRGLQSLFNLSGKFHYRIDGSEDVAVLEREYLLYSAQKEVLHTTVEPGRLSALLQVYFSEQSYAALLPLFPDFAQTINEEIERPFYFLQGPAVAPFQVHDAIRSILHDRYAHHLQQKNIELHLERSLFEQLRQGSITRTIATASPLENEKATEARHLLLNNIKRHWTLDDLALELNCTTSWLKKAFSKVHGTGVYHFLRRTRMEKAKSLFQKGESLKAVAIEVGMKPHNFPKEFKAYFGYTVTQFKKSLR